MHVASVVGARPQFVKLAALDRAMARLRVTGVSLQHTIIHTGQHYDRELSESFFEELELPPPDHDLGVGSTTYAAQVGRMLERLEPVLRDANPDVVLVVGDTNSTVAAALAASSLSQPVAHVEAGLRSRRMDMPEERNRIVTDHLSTWLFASSRTGATHLQQEGLQDRCLISGDVMYDVLLWKRERLAPSADEILDRLGLERNTYALATIHRPVNTDDPTRLQALLDGMAATGLPVVFPVHPRTRKSIGAVRVPHAIDLRPPLAYDQMIVALGAASRCFTDSGGVQKEAMWLRVPCVTLREETEWPETVAAGWNRLAGSDAIAIQEAALAPGPDGDPPNVYGDGRAADVVIAALVSSIGAR